MGWDSERFKLLVFESLERIFIEETMLLSILHAFIIDLFTDSRYGIIILNKKIKNKTPKTVNASAIPVMGGVY